MHLKKCHLNFVLGQHFTNFLFVLPVNRDWPTINVYRLLIEINFINHFRFFLAFVYAGSTETTILSVNSIPLVEMINFRLQIILQIFILKLYIASCNLLLSAYSLMLLISSRSYDRSDSKERTSHRKSKHRHHSPSRSSRQRRSQSSSSEESSRTSQSRNARRIRRSDSRDRSRGSRNRTSDPKHKHRSEMTKLRILYCEFLQQNTHVISVLFLFLL